MDRYHRAFDVCTDVSSGGNHFLVFGLKASPGDVKLVTVDTCCTAPRYSGDTSIRCQLGVAPGAGQQRPAHWGGYYFLNGVVRASDVTPQPNWGDVPGAGFNLSGATKVTFWAKGERGGEVVEFFALGGGWNPRKRRPIMPHPDSSSKVSLGLIRLRPSWTQYAISLTRRNLSYVIGDFGWSTSVAYNRYRDVVFYLDDNRYNKPRLDEPRFLRSYETLPTGEPFDQMMKNTAYTYDNALVLLAFLARGQADDLRRAKLLADALVYGVDNNRQFSDGRLRNAYKCRDLAHFPGWQPNGKPNTVRLPR